MKQAVIFFVLLLLVGGVSFLFFKMHSMKTIPTRPIVTSSPSSQNLTFCTPSAVQAVVAPDTAAGNVYAALSIKNISDASCQILGNNMPQIDYPLSVTNFKTDSKDTPTTPVFTLTPNQTIYSLIHYPNGPQCSSKATDVDAAVSYKISPTDSITFNPAGGPTIGIPSCGKTSEITLIDLYSFSDKTVLPH